MQQLLKPRKKSKKQGHPAKGCVLAKFYDKNSTTFELSDNQEIFLDYKQEINIIKKDKIREEIIIQYLPLVKYVAGNIKNTLPDCIDFEDLVGYGVFGLLDAIEKYDPLRDILFKTYAVTRIRGAIYDELRSIDWAPRSIRQKAKEVERAISKIEDRKGESVTDIELAEELNISYDEVQKILQDISGITLLSISDIWYMRDDSDKVSIIETITDERYDTENEIVKNSEYAEIRRKVEYLPKKERETLRQYYWWGLNLKEIGVLLNVTESRVSQLHTKAIMRLRHLEFPTIEEKPKDETKKDASELLKEIIKNGYLNMLSKSIGRGEESLRHSANCSKSIGYVFIAEQIIAFYKDFIRQ